MEAKFPSCNKPFAFPLQVLQLTVIWRGVLLEDLLTVFKEDQLGTTAWFFGLFSILALISRYWKKKSCR
jgi:hypothetical protein